MFLPKVLRLTAALAVSAALVAVSGCGDDKKQDNSYVDAVNRAQNEFAATIKSLGRRITTASSASEDRRTLDGFQQGIDKVVADLRAVEAPPEVAVLHKRLASEISSYGDEVRRAQEGFASRKPSRIRAAQARLAAAVTRVSARINTTIDAINRKLQG